MSSSQIESAKPKVDRRDRHRRPGRRARSGARRSAPPRSRPGSRRRARRARRTRRAGPRRPSRARARPRTAAAAASAPRRTSCRRRRSRRRAAAACARATSSACACPGTRGGLPGPPRSCERSAMRRSVASPSGLSSTSRFASRAASGPALRSSSTSCSTAASRSSATSCTRPMRNAVVGVEALAGDEVAPRRARPDLRERERRDHRRDDPQLHLGEARTPFPRPRPRCPRTRRGPRRRRARGRARGRRPARGSRRSSRASPKPARVLDVLVVAQVRGRAHPLDVRAGAEALALAREHDRARVADVGERLAQLGDQRRVEGVPLPGRASVTRSTGPSLSMRSAVTAAKRRLPAC